ncbi:hypothetical protein [Spirillospora sp. CA-294931]|uniref:hypothetical protein n=1 Tax=Spirillospora sp. CA-294931 TaxID=3240042 RepID=UPI003D89D7DD
MANNNPAAQSVGHATSALVAYEQSAFPSHFSSLPDDPAYAQALLGALVCDLAHYASANGLDFAQAVDDGRQAHAAELADQTRFTFGDQVSLRLHPGRRGLVADVRGGDDAVYLVAVPGVPYLYEERAADLEPAPPLPPISTGLPEPVQAESALVELAAHIHSKTPCIGDQARQDYESALTALSEWSGTPAYELLKALAPRITTRIRQLTAANDSGAPTTPDPVRLSEESFPEDLTNGVFSEPVARREADPEKPATAAPSQRT